MPLDEPSWWYGEDDRRAHWLAPVARIWGRVAQARHTRQAPYRSRLPVICIGNFTAGGTGKTPLALHIAALLKAAGEHPALLTRGYGGHLAGPLWVEPARHDASEVGDEPLLLARTAPVMLARDRRLGALAIEQAGTEDLARAGGTEPISVIVMDDGLQNPALAKDLSIALVDGLRGVGNGRVIPAGPLRAPLEFQLGIVDAIVVTRPLGAPAPGRPGVETGEDATASPRPRVLESLRQGFPGPVLAAEQRPDGDTAWLRGARVYAYAGIGNPDRFFATLRGLGADLVATVRFADHHAFNDAEAARLIDKAEQSSATLVTTEKDWARLAACEKRDGATTARARLAAASRTLPIQLEFEPGDAARLADMVLTAARTGGYRRGLRRG